MVSGFRPTGVINIFASNTLWLTRLDADLIKIRVAGVVNNHHCLTPDESRHQLN